MWIAEFLTRDLSLDRPWRRLPRGRERLDEILDIAHFTLIVNGAALLVACFVAPSAFNVLNPINGPDLGTFAVRSLELSLPIWCLTFGVRFWNALRDWYRRVVRGRRRVSVEVESSGLWDEWLDGPAWIRSPSD
jgi:hypothetical protein